MKKLAPWSLFVACLLLLGIGSTPLGPAADHAFVAFRFAALLFLSVLVVRRKFRREVDQDRGDALLASFHRWCRGESR